MTLPTKPSKDEATAELQKIINSKDSRYDLVPIDKFKSGKNLRFDRYKAFHVLCYAYTHKQAGWLVCNYALIGGCKLGQALLIFNTSTGGTARLERHIAQHRNVKPNVMTLPKDLPQLSKTNIARCAALAVALDLRPIGFTDNQEGLLQFVEAIFRAGQATPVSDRINPKSLLPCTKTVSTAITKLAEENREQYKTLLPVMIRTGGAVSTDGVTLKVQDKQFYDLTLHFIDIPQRAFYDPTTRFSMKCKTLLLQEKKGDGNAEQIRGLLGNALKSYYGVDIDTLTKGFTMVTDNASVMARVAGASVSSRIAPLTEKWMGCAVHQINTALKSCISELTNQEELNLIFEDLQAVKKIVRIFKQSNWNSLLPQGHKLIQEVETRFGTTFQVVERFLKSSNHVQAVIATKDSVPAKNALESLQKSISPSGDVHYPALESIVDAFQDVIALQTALQASNSPTIHIALPQLKRCTDKLQSIVDGSSVWRGEEAGFVPAPRLSRKLCHSTIEWLNAKVRIHPLMMAGCYMNPLFREFQFIDDLNKRQSYLNGGEAMVRSMIANFVSEGQSITSSAEISQGESRPTTNGTNNVPCVAGRKRTFSLMEYADSHFQPLNTVDEVSRYNCMDISQLPIDREKYMRDEFAAVRFWHMHRSAFPNLYKVALRLYAVPVSSCASERVFSAVNRVVTRDRASMSSTTLEDIIVVRSLMSK